MRKLLTLLLLALVLPLALAACAPATPPVEDIVVEEDVDLDGGLAEELADVLDEIDPDHPLANLMAIQARFPVVAGRNNPNPPVEGGTLRVAVGASTPPPMIYAGPFQREWNDSLAMTWFAGGSNTGGVGSIFDFTPARTFGQTGPATWEADIENMTFTITMAHDIFWHDGVQVTLDDLVFAYEVIAHPDYEGLRWNMVENVVGTTAFHNLETDAIEGLVLSEDGRQLTMHFYTFPPSLLHAGFWTAPFPRHIFGDVPVAEMVDHPAARVNPIGWGPFMVQNIVSGESVHLVANENFWLGRPYLDEVIIQFVHGDLIPTMLAAGEIDIAEFPLEHFSAWEDATAFQFVGDVSAAWNWVSFRLGVWNPETAQIEVNPDAKLADVRVRRAMGFAVNEQAWTDSFWEGLRFPATSPIPPNHSAFLNPDLAGFRYDPDRARAYLDDAGFDQFDEEGYRLDPNGERFTIVFAHSIAPNHELMAQFYIQSWAEVGLRVELFEGRLHDFTSIQENLYMADNWPEVDIHAAAWVAGFDPAPSGLWGHTPNNRPRFINEELQMYMDNIDSMQAWDTDWLITQYHAWQEAFYRHAPVIPTQWRISLEGVNNRVINYMMMSNILEDGLQTQGGLHRIQVTSHDPYRQ